MSTEIEKKFIGIDMGTDYLGYVATDENYKVLKSHGKNVLGVVQFDDAQTAVQRRGFRTSSRRLVRRHYRLTLLQELFADEVMAKDDNFFRHLQENDLKPEDRLVSGKYSLFNDQGFTDVQYYQKYPTIYHLRKALAEGKIDDIRLLYLAIHHIVKYRGHFLFDGEIKSADDIDVRPQIAVLNDAIEARNADLDSYDEDEEVAINRLSKLSVEKIDEVKALLIGKNDSKGRLIKGNDLKRALHEAFAVSTKHDKAMIDGLVVGKLRPLSIFGKDAYDQEEAKEIGYGTYEDSIPVYLNGNDLAITNALKGIYDWFVLTKLLNGCKTLSESMIRIYETHKKDLAELKSLLKDYGGSDVYESMFGKSKAQKDDGGDSEAGDKKDKKNDVINYSAYVGGGLTVEGDYINRDSIKRSEDENEFYSFVKKTIEKIKAPEAQDVINGIKDRIESGNYMPRIVTKNNSTLPYQLNKMELEMILNAAIKSGKFDFLSVKRDGYTVAQKVMMLLEFRIPYYVGPIKYYKKKEDNKHGWAVFRDDSDYSRITPWNFDNKIDRTESNKKFIEKMTSQCTYLRCRKALPKHSPIFERFEALNELNKLKVNGSEMSVELKQDIFENVHKKVKATIRNVKLYLINNKGYEKDVRLSGFDQELKGDMPTYRAFKGIVGEKLDMNPRLFEDIAVILTIHSERQMILEAIKEKNAEYDNALTEQEINGLANKKLSGWGSLSGELLMGSIYGKDGFQMLDEGGELRDILTVLYETNANFMQVINDERYGFARSRDKFWEENNIRPSGSVSYKDVEEMYCSPSVKKCVWQSFKVIKELSEETMKSGLAAKIFIECTREKNDASKKKRTQSRVDMIKEKLDNAKKKLPEEVKNIESVEKSLMEFDNDKLRREKLYLYFIQLGKCAYTGESINISELEQYYDIDHIFPQSKVKDDSLTNKVLVKKEVNGKKKDVYPIPQAMRQPALWRSWYKMELITQDKYERLIRTTPLTDEEQEKFINRQLVETAQATKLLRDLLVKWYKDCGVPEGKIEIDLVKAGAVSEFRKEYGLTKSRDVNDFHHAYDAYLNVVVGNVLYEHFNHNPNYKLIAERAYEEANNPDNYTTEEKKSVFIRCFKRYIKSYRTGKYVWVPLNNKNGDEPTLTLVNRTCKLIPNFTKKVYRGKGLLHKETVFKAGIGTYPLKDNGPKSDIGKYGGYKNSGTAYFLVVDSDDKKGKTIRTIEAMPIYYDNKIHAGRMTMEEFLGTLDKVNPRLAKINGLKDSVIKVGTLMLVDDDYYVRLTGITGNRIILNNANQLYVPPEINRYIKEMRVLQEKTIKAIKLGTEEEKAIAREKYFEELINENIRRVNNPNQKSDIVVVSKEENMKIYEFFIEKLSSAPYVNIPTYDSLLNVTSKSRKCFEEMTIYNQMGILLNLIIAFQANSGVVNATSLHYIDEKGKKVTGVKNHCSIKLSNDITSRIIVLITKSISGLIEKKIDISL